MANPLKEMRVLVQPTLSKTLLGTVITSSNNKLSVRLAGGNTIIVWGDESVGAEVLIRENAVVASISRESISTVYIP